MTQDAFDQFDKMTVSTQLEIASVCDDTKTLLLAKNAKYGDSALNPCRIFSKASAIEQILVRIDDKLNRVSQGIGLLADDEDVVNDLIGYLILLKIALKRQKPTEPDLLTGYDFERSENGYLGGDPWTGIDIEPVFTFRVA